MEHEASLSISNSRSSTWRDYLDLCKPKVVSLIMLTTIVGMCLSTPGMIPMRALIFGNIGICLAAFSAAAINQLVDQHIDSLMRRTQNRPLVQGKVTVKQSIIFAAILCALSMIILVSWVNTLTAVLTFFTVIGYAGIYTLYLKHATPQNIVIGGLSGAVPPLLGWVAVTGHIDPRALLLVLIIFVWTPPHFWALAIYREEDYRKAKVPMLPNTHGVRYTKINIILYTCLLFAVSILPFAVSMTSVFYLVGVSILNIRFLHWTLKLWKTDDIRVAFKTFKYSIVYLMYLFLLLLIDHYLIGSHLHFIQNLLTK